MDQNASYLRQYLLSCESGDVAWVEHALQSNMVQVDDCDEQGVTGLQMAAANGHEDLARSLVMKGAALDKSNYYDWTPLMHAARHGHTGVATLLLQNNADVNAKSRLGANALTYAAKGGHVKMVQLLIDAGIEFDLVAAPCELTAMFVASLLGYDAIVRLLSERGWDINQRMQSTFMTPLMCASINGHMITAQHLMERGCDPNLTDINDKTALQLASDSGKREVTGFLDRKTSTKLHIVPEEELKSDIIEATKNGDAERVKEILLEDSSQMDFSYTQDGATPLMFASMSGRLDIAKILVESGCDIDKQDKISSWTALMQAIFHGKKLVAKYLIDNGADVSLSAKNRITAFDMASFIDDVDTDLLRLLASRAMSNKGSKKGDSLKKNAKRSSTVDGLEGAGIKWWNRLSSRFKNLTKTFQLKNKQASSEKSKVKMSKLSSTSTLNLPLISLSDLSQDHSLSFMDKKKSASLYHLNSINPHTTATMPLGLGGGGASGGETLKPVIPPFLPQPSFNLASEAWGMPTQQKSQSTLDLTVNNKHPMIRPVSVRSGRDAATSPTSEHPYSFGSPSPESSGGASGIGAIYFKPSTSGSSATSSTLTPGGYDRFHRRPLLGELPAVRPPSFLLNSNQKYSLPRLYSSSSSFSPNSSGSSVSHSYSSFNKSKPMKSRNISPNLVNEHRNGTGIGEPGASGNSDSLSFSYSSGGVIHELEDEQEEITEKDQEERDLGNVLKNLSLEKYQPIFEKEEVDMEAFLMLNETDLCELGITHTDSRRQILNAISELSSAKHVHRRADNELTEDLAEATIRLRNSMHSDSTDLDDWYLHESHQGGTTPG